MNLGSGDEGSDAATTLDEAFVLKGGQRVAGGHQADLMHFGEVTLGGDRIAGAKVAGVDAFADGALNTLVGRNIRTQFGGHANDSSKPGTWKAPKAGTKFDCQRMRNEKELAPRKRKRGGKKNLKK
jgi:hypothetical protein